MNRALRTCTVCGVGREGWQPEATRSAGTVGSRGNLFRVAGTPSATASALTLMPSGARQSFRRTSPGCTGPWRTTRCLAVGDGGRQGLFDARHGLHENRRCRCFSEGGGVSRSCHLCVSKSRPKNWVRQPFQAATFLCRLCRGFVIYNVIDAARLGKDQTALRPAQTVSSTSNRCRMSPQRTHKEAGGDHIPTRPATMNRA